MGNTRIELPMEDIIKDYQAGMQIIDLAYKYYVSETTIHTRLRELGIKKKRFGQDNAIRQIPIDEIKKLYIEELLSAFEIGKRYGVSKGVVLAYLKENNIPIRTQGQGKKAYLQRLNQTQDKYSKLFN